MSPRTHWLTRSGSVAASAFLVLTALAQPSAVAASTIPAGPPLSGTKLLTADTAPDPYPRAAAPITLQLGAQQITARPLRTTLLASGAQVLADRILVRFSQPVTDADLAAIQAKASKAGGGAAQALVRIGANSVLIDVTGAASIEAAATAYLGADTRVQGAGPDYLMRSHEVPNDPDFPKQWGMAKIQAPAAWNRTHGSVSQVIAVLDSGLNDQGADANPEFGGKAVDHHDFTGSSIGTDDVFGHGTHVAGIAAAGTNNALGVAGAGYDSRLLIGKVLDDTGSGSMSQLTDAIFWAADHGATVINMSLGSTDRQDCNPAWYETLFDAGRAELRDAIDYATSKNVVVVASAGNNGDTQQLWPAACPNVLSVANTDANDNLSASSTRGTWVDVAAPGSGIWSTTVPGGAVCQSGIVGGEAFCSGTSMAAPHVSGLAALVRASCGFSSAASVVSRITSMADAVAGTGTNFQFGRVNALRSVCFPAPTGLRLTGFLTSTSLQFSWSDTTPFESRFELWFRANGGAWSFVNVPANTTSFSHTGLIEGASYEHKIRACDALGCSGFSNSVIGTAGFKSLNVSILGAGKVTGPGITCGRGFTDCADSYAPGTIVQLHPEPYINLQKNIEWDFDHWEGACAGQSWDCTLTMSSNVSTKAVFVLSSSAP
jgi:thermitase